MADKPITQFQLADQFTMDNFNQRIEETNTALENIDTYTKQQIEEINTALQNIDVYTKAQTLSDATKLQYGLNSNAIPDNVFERLSHFTPTGAVFWLASETVPEGFLLCDGSSVSRADYPLLFQAIGTAFGSDNDTTFKLPDLRAKFVRGAGSSGSLSATFGQTQNATGLNFARGSRAGIINVDGIQQSISERLAPLSSQYEDSYGQDMYAVRPYNIALTPVIKYL